MNPDTYYRDHWVEIESERLDAYEEMFAWRPQMAPLLEPAEIGPGQVIVDYGCGPGGLAVELARRVGREGRVHGFDLNAEMVRRAAARAEREGIAGQMHFAELTDDRLPLDDASVDRVVCKNVMEYVTDPSGVLRELRRVLKPGGRLHVVDSDWGLLVVEPIGEPRMRRLFGAATSAYRTPLIGRLLYGLMRGAGFDEVRVKVLCPADTKGYLSQVVTNMASYARAAGSLDEAVIDDIVADVHAAIENGTFLLVLPQFLVTGLVGE